MTEIKIEKKKSSGLWVIIVLVILGIILYLYFSSKNKPDEEAVNNRSNMEQTTSSAKDNAVTGYVSFVNDDVNKMGLDHAYTNNALLKLTNAIEAKANEIGYDVKADLFEARKYADEITTDAFETTHAKNIRMAADVLSTSLGNMQQAKYPNLTAETDKLKKAATSIKPNVLTMDQKEAVKSFFSNAADLLNKMN